MAAGFEIGHQAGIGSAGKEVAGSGNGEALTLVVKE